MQIIEKKTFMKRLIILTIAAFTVLSVTSIHKVFATEKVNDVALKSVMGGVKFTANPCGVETHPVCILSPVFNTGCNPVPNQAGGRDIYSDTQWPEYVCNGDPKPDPPHCNPGLHSVDTVERNFYSATPLGTVCSTFNWSETVWLCSFDDCRDINITKRTGQKVQ